MMKVYHAPFARSLRILWTLEELNAPYELVRVQFPPKVAAYFDYVKARLAFHAAAAHA